MKYRKIEVEMTSKVKELASRLLAAETTARAKGNEVVANMLLDAESLNGNELTMAAITEAVTMVGVLKADEAFEGFSDDELAGIILDQLLNPGGHVCPGCGEVH